MHHRILALLLTLVLTPPLTSGCKKVEDSTLSATTPIAGKAYDFTRYKSAGSKEHLQMKKEINTYWPKTTKHWTSPTQYPDNYSYIEGLVAKNKTAHSKLNRAEVVAVLFYTQPFYAQIQAALRIKNAIELPKLVNTIKTITTALNKLPKTKCRVYRGLKFNEPTLKMVQEAVKAGHVLETAFMSTGAKDIATKYYMTTSGTTSLGYLMQIDSTNCRDITWVRKGFEGTYNHRELVFPPGSKFKILKHVKATKTKAGLLELKEVPDLVAVTSGSKKNSVPVSFDKYSGRPTNGQPSARTKGASLTELPAYDPESAEPIEELPMLDAASPSEMPLETEIKSDLDPNAGEGESKDPLEILPLEQ